jgi:hypothetical protein
MPLSVLDPIAPAIARTKWMLFQPFDLGKWLRLGFCAFLMGFAQSGGGGGGSFPGPWGGGGPGGGQDGDRVAEFFREYLVIIVVVAIVIVLVFVAIGLVLTWLGSRGHFMFLDGVVHNRGEVAAPWREYRREANSLFLFRICLGIAALLLIAAIAGVCILIAWPDIQSRDFGSNAAVATVLGIGLSFAFVFSILIISLFLTDFVVPIMYLRRILVTAAWDAFYVEMLVGNKWLFARYVLMKIVIGLLSGMLAFAAMCMTCCVAALPYVSSVVLLPLTVFSQTYALYFIQQFGPEWRIFPVPSQDAPGTPGV